MIEDEDLSWYHLSVCDGMEVNWFYDDYEADPVFATTIDSICLSCPVRDMCLKEGIENKEYGVWGGVFLVNGKIDPQRNAHKTQDVWEGISKSVE